MTTDPRIEAALNAICEQDGIDYEDMKHNEPEEYRDWLGWLDKPFAAADAVMFSEEAIERAAQALAASLTSFKWEDIGPRTRDMYRAKARAVVAALRGETG